MVMTWRLTPTRDGALQSSEGFRSGSAIDYRQDMRITYYSDTDSLYIDLSSKPSADSREVSDGVVLDYDEDGNLAGIDIDEASTKLDIRELILNKLPAEVKQVG